MENKERKQRHCSEEAKRQAASSLCCLASLAHQWLALATPGLPATCPTPMETSLRPHMVPPGWVTP